MNVRSAHKDTFVIDGLPQREDWPLLELDPRAVPELAYPERLNCAALLIDRMAEQQPDRPALRDATRAVTYRELAELSSRIAHVLVDDLRLVPGGRVLLRGVNDITMAAAWLAVLKAGGVVVTTMPLLRAREIAYILDKARIGIALCDATLTSELDAARERAETAAALRVMTFGADAGAELGVLAAAKPSSFAAVDTAAEDPALIAFTSGTTGRAKGTVHFHRDVIASCDCWPRYVVRPVPDDVFTGTPPLAFTYGLGGLLVFPLRFGASSVLIAKPSPETLLTTIAERRVTTLFTSPTMYRALLDHVRSYDIGSLLKCVSAGEPLPLSTFEAWKRATGLSIIDGIGATEMFHIFISAAGDEIRPGATGKAVPGYRARVVDDAGEPLRTGEVGKLAVIGPTGCRYLADPERQHAYVQNGWNLTGDAYRMDEDGYFWFQARADDMIISAGYNIAGLEVENVLLEHAKVKECGVVGTPDEERGHIVHAFIVLRDAQDATAETVKELQDFVKAQIAPYKYPRRIEFVDALPRTETGKLQRFRLRQPSG